MKPAVPRLTGDPRPVPLPAPVTSASSDDALQAALIVSPGLAAVHLAAADATYRAARQAHGAHWEALDTERAALAHAMQRARDALAGEYPNHHSAAWWAVKVAELRACLAAEERFRDTGRWQDGMSEAQRTGARPVSTSVLTARLAKQLHPSEAAALADLIPAGPINRRASPGCLTAGQ